MIRPLLLSAALIVLGQPLLAGEITVTDAYMRLSSPVAKSGAAFMVIENHGTRADRVIAVQSDIAKRTELHTHRTDDKGMMHMLELPEGIALPAMSAHRLARGADHVMFMGLTRPLKEGDHVRLVLDFEHSEPLTVDMQVTMGEAPSGAKTKSGMAHNH